FLCAATAPTSYVSYSLLDALPIFCKQRVRGSSPLGSTRSCPTGTRDMRRRVVFAFHSLPVVTHALSSSVISMQSCRSGSRGVCRGGCDRLSGVGERIDNSLVEADRA